MHPASRLLTAVALAVASASTLAAPTIYTSSAAFLAQVAPTAYTETFTAVVDDNTNVQTFTGNGNYGFTASLDAGQQFYFGTDALSTNLPNEVITLTFTGGPVTAIGANFYAIDIGDMFIPSPLTILLADGSATTLTFTPGDASAYRGFTSQVAITSITFSASAQGAYATLDNLTIGGTHTVPEPSSIALIALAFAGAAAARRRAI
ncbi:MAG: PEP-CTERM sorting domain-containing protein [Pelomonas sp.]|nr:PEP-CTERM sorting domain-containing protein [Roseateles sp.]